MKNAIYFANTFPRHNYSAACERVFKNLIILNKNGYTVNFVSASEKGKSSNKDFKLYADYRWIYLNPNDSDAINKYLVKSDPLEICFFDSFIAEEYYSHHIYKRFPGALKVIDTQDLHSLRLFREKCAHSQSPSKLDIRNYIDLFPDSSDPIHSRELASIFRSDLVITSSDFEEYKLRQKYNLKNILTHGFCYSSEEFIAEKLINNEEFHKRKNFVSLGNFKHKANEQMVDLLVSEIWPKIRKNFKNAELHIYGSEFPKKFESIESIEGVKKLNLMKDLHQLRNYRWLMAPLFFGAGIKGFYN